MPQPKKEYALYKGDQLIAIGTKEHLANIRGVKVDTISYYASPTYARRTSEVRSLRVVALE